jgi:uncharacterized protein RhaS with RHS repeats
LQASLKLKTTYGRNAYGLVSSVNLDWQDPVTSQARSRIAVRTGYDAKGRFATTTTNALDQVETRTFDAGNGAMTSVTSPNLLTAQIEVDGFGRKKREIAPDGNSVSSYEVFTYDDLNRPETATVGARIETFTYDSIGNMTSKTGAGTYTYPNPGAVRPHAVTNIGSLGAFTYDDNGNLKTGDGRTLEWTSFDMPASITQLKGGVTKSSGFAYGAPAHAPDQK